MVGSCESTHLNFGAVNPGIIKLPVISREFGTSFSNSAHSCTLRPSFHKIAGRRMLSCLSNKVAPCICPVKPMAFTALRSCRDDNASIALLVACHQSCGSCSDQSGCGREIGNDCCVVAMICCSSLSKTTFTPDVPRSIPMYMGTPFVLCCLI